jgi:hypothetical protein
VQNIADMAFSTRFHVTIGAQRVGGLPVAYKYEWCPRVFVAHMRLRAGQRRRLDPEVHSPFALLILAAPERGYFVVTDARKSS